jgi:predicted lipoprotein
MQKAMRLPKSFTLERSIVSYLQNTRGTRSSSERVNELLRKAILQEQYERLEQEAAEFFSAPSETDRAEAKAFQKASMRSMGRD